jgi:DUF438 domain-containing protein
MAGGREGECIMDEKKKAIVKEVIRGLHTGLGVEQAKERILRDVGHLSSSEIAGIEQSLIDEGVPAEEIKRFCNVHALLFEAAMDHRTPGPAPANPLRVLREENREIERIVAGLKKSMEESRIGDALAGIAGGLRRLKEMERHYILKENAIFPYLEKHGFSGPSQVMWGKHNDIRSMLRSAESGLAASKNMERLGVLRKAILEPLIAEVEGMIFKEENILFPAAMEKILPEEWARIAQSFGEIAPAYTPQGSSEAPAAPAAGGEIELPSGRLSLGQLEAMLNVLPVDVSFVDASGKVAYFNQTPKRIFPRSVSVIGRSVQNCHPPQSVHKVTAILEAFRKGERDRAEFWINLNGRFVSIRYFAVRDKERNYLGCLEVSQDLTDLRALEGERRLLED